MGGTYGSLLAMTADSSKSMETEKMAIGQREERVVCRFPLSPSFMEGMWCHGKSLPPG